MPAFVKSRLGEDGMSEAEGTISCPRERKWSRKVWRISEESMLRLKRIRNGGSIPKEERVVF